MKKFVALLLACALVTAGWLGVRQFRSSPRRTVEHFLDALSTGKISRAERYIREDSLTAGGMDRYGKRFYKQMYSTLSYRITQIEVDGDTARVTVAVTMVDMDALLSQTTLSSLSEPGLLGRSNYYKEVTRQIKSGEAAYVLNTARAYVVKENGRWKVSLSDSSSFAAAITGGRAELLGHAS